jgi:hypothetical protein
VMKRAVVFTMPGVAWANVWTVIGEPPNRLLLHLRLGNWRLRSSSTEMSGKKVFSIDALSTLQPVS